MNVAVTGGSGLLGAHIAAALSRRHSVTSIDRNPWWGDSPVPAMIGDLGDSDFVKRAILETRPNVFIHCAGMTDVDACEKDPEMARRQIVDVAAQIVSNSPSDCLLVYVSTDSVFGGESSFWSETDSPEPRNVYAASKLEAERLASRHPNHLILRTNFYGWSSGRKKTSAEWLYWALKRNEAITLFDDFFSTPIYVTDLVTRISLMIDLKLRGLFHLAGRDRVSKYSFGETMARLMNVPMTGVQRGSILQKPLAAPRSRDISLSSGKACLNLGMDVPGCEEGLRLFLSHASRPLSQRFSGAEAQ